MGDPHWKTAYPNTKSYTFQGMYTIVYVITGLLVPPSRLKMKAFILVLLNKNIVFMDFSNTKGSSTQFFLKLNEIIALLCVDYNGLQRNSCFCK